MDQEIAEIIKRNLPAQVGEALQKELARIPTLEKELLDASSLVEGYRVEREALVKRALDATMRVAAAEVVLKREAGVAERERVAEIFELKARLAASDISISRLFDFVGLLVKAPAFRETVQRSTQVPLAMPGSNGGNPWVITQQATENITTERTTE